MGESHLFTRCIVKKQYSRGCCVVRIRRYGSLFGVFCSWILQTLLQIDQKCVSTKKKEVYLYLWLCKMLRLYYICICISEFFFPIEYIWWGYMKTMKIVYYSELYHCGNICTNFSICQMLLGTWLHRRYYNISMCGRMEYSLTEQWVDRSSTILSRDWNVIGLLRCVCSHICLCTTLSFLIY